MIPSQISRSILLCLIAAVAQGSAGRDGMWRARMDSAMIEKVYGWAKQRNALLFLDVQVGKSTMQRELPPLMKFLVAGAGSWGTAFAHVLLERGHDVVLACHTAEQARAVAETGRNPRYLPQVDLRRAEAVALDDAPAPG